MDRKRVCEHIIKEGARYHVIWWDTNGHHCSEPNCKINHPDKKIGDKIPQQSGAENGKS
jgi:hypothetical protein